MMRHAWIRGRVVLMLAAVACGGDSTGPDTGSLEISVTGLPGGTPANVSVVGPSGFSQAIVGPQTLTDLPPGSYTVTASPVSAGGEVYAADPASQSVTVTGGSTASSTVAYGASSGGLAVTISGLPTGVSAEVEVSGPGGYFRLLTAGTTLTGLLPGVYTLAAQPVADGATAYLGNPLTQDATVSAGATANTAVTYTESSTSGMNLRIDGLYLTQSVQTYNRDVPLIANRDAFLRVFVTSTQGNVLSPTVRVRLYHGGVLASEQTIPRVGMTPLAPQEGTLGNSWNLAVPKALVTPNLSILVEVDPGQRAGGNQRGRQFLPRDRHAAGTSGRDRLDIPSDARPGDHQRRWAHRERDRRKQESVSRVDDADASALGVRRTGRRPPHGGRQRARPSVRQREQLLEHDSEPGRSPTGE